MDDVLDDYFRAYNYHKGLDDRRKAAAKDLAKAKEALESFYAGLGVSSMTREGRSAGISFKRYSKVDDFNALDKHMKKQEEPESEYMERIFRKDALKKMLDGATEEAVREGKSVHECLPPGLSFYMKTVVTVRKTSKDDGVVISEQTLREQYQKMMEEE